MNESVNDEIKTALNNDLQVLGSVYRLQDSGRSPKEISDQFGGQTYNKLQIIEAILGLKYPQAISIAHQCVSAINGLIRNNNFSSETQRKLEERRGICYGIAESPELREEQEKKDKKEIEKIKDSSIYAYTLPHYRDKPYIDSDDEKIMKDRTMIKVGRTTQDVWKRINQQKTGLPEQPVYLLGWVI